MLWFKFFKKIKKIKNYFSRKPLEMHAISYADILWPWMRGFVFWWFRYFFVFILGYVVTIPAHSLWVHVFGDRIISFWTIYMPVCSLFFAVIHYSWGDSSQPMNFLCIRVLVRIRNLIRVFFG